METDKAKPSFKHRVILILIPVACFIIRMITWTMKIELIDPHGIAPQSNKHEKFIYAFWHNQQILSTSFFRNFDIHVLVSRSKDGDYIAKALHHFHFKTVRSSTSSGKVNALRGLTRAIKAGFHTAITPDGPRGPIYKAQPGAVFLAALSGYRIAPYGSAVNKVWRLSRTWDQFEFPRPFSKAVIVFGEPVTVSRKLDDATAENYRKQIENAMLSARQDALAKIKENV